MDEFFFSYCATAYFAKLFALQTTWRGLIIISKDQKMMLFVCDKYRNNCKRESKSMSKYDGIYLKIKSDIWKIGKNFRSRHWITIMKPLNNFNNQYQGWGKLRVWQVCTKKSKDKICSVAPDNIENGFIHRCGKLFCNKRYFSNNELWWSVHCCRTTYLLSRK